VYIVLRLLIYLVAYLLSVIMCAKEARGGGVGGAVAAGGSPQAPVSNQRYFSRHLSQAGSSSASQGNSPEHTQKALSEHRGGSVRCPSLILPLGCASGALRKCAHAMPSAYHTLRATSQHAKNRGRHTPHPSHGGTGNLM
jgi:hypothetical protein